MKTIHAVFIFSWVSCVGAESKIQPTTTVPTVPNYSQNQPIQEEHVEPRPPVSWRGGSTTTTTAEETTTSSSSSTILGQDEAATESLEVSIPLSQSSALSKNDEPLMRDIAMLTDILSVLVQKEDMKTHQFVEEFLEYGGQRYVLPSLAVNTYGRTYNERQGTHPFHFLHPV